VEEVAVAEVVVVAAAEVAAAVVAVAVAEVCWQGGGKSQVHWDSSETCLLWYWCSLGMRKHPG
jgi:hypothetical protein